MSVRFLVTGRVQGVGFRWFVRRRADTLGLTGSVRNLTDGSVEVIVDGPAERIEQLAVELAGGPPSARVDGVERSDVPGRSEHGRFTVL